MKLNSQQLKDRNYKALEHVFSLIEDKSMKIVFYYNLGDNIDDQYKFTHTLNEPEKFKRWFYQINNFSINTMTKDYVIKIKYTNENLLLLANKIPMFKGSGTRILNYPILCESLCSEKIRNAKLFDDLINMVKQ